MAIAFWISGCSAAPSENLPTPIEGYNHTSAAINRFTVNGAGGLQLWPAPGGAGVRPAAFLYRRNGVQA
ncbi:DUF3304 domain-containing protein [Pseudomonas sp. ATCC 13867]|nr:DUF3304 domain-containing protein [Pseudomonas sp. ATCC 13867]